MPDFSELQAKFSSDMDKMEGDSPYKPKILRKAEEPENLRRFLFDLSQAFSEEMIEDAYFGLGNYFYDYQRKMVAVQYKSWLYGEHLETKTVYYPRNWFEHLKATILPGFILERWPAKMEGVEVDIRALYPKLRRKLHYPDEPHVIHGVVKPIDEEE